MRVRGLVTRVTFVTAPSPTCEEDLVKVARALTAALVVFLVSATGPVAQSSLGSSLTGALGTLMTGGITGQLQQNWAPVAQATIRPGVQTVTSGAQCTANFVFHDSTNVYIGQAAHCASTGSSTDVNGCEAGALPLGTQVQVGGASQPGTIVYSSWITMQSVNEGNLGMCLGNDFALIRLDPADHGKVNPTVPFWGGPTGLDPSSGLLEPVYAYGNSSLRGGLAALSPKVGTGTGQSNGGWTHNVYTATPGIPGDSGSAYLGSGGGALGVLSTISIPTLSNQVSDLSRALSYMYTHTGLDGVRLAEGTEAFTVHIADLL